MHEVPDAETRLLSEREQGRGPRERVEPVPRALEPHLRSWLAGFLHPRLERRVAARLGLELTPRDRIPSTVGPPRELAWHPALQGTVLLDAVDLALQWDQALSEQLGLQQLTPPTDDGEPWPQFARLRELTELDELLGDGRSTYQVWVPPAADTARLVSRVDPAMQAGADRAGATADVTTSELIRRAWSKAFGLSTDPDGAYLDGLRAVERLACPLVLPDNGRASLNNVVQHLNSPGGAAKWELVLAKAGDGSVEPIVAMFDRLWHGNLASRHGSLAYREVTLAEARAGVQLAVVLVQWLSDDSLRRRTIPDTP